MASECETVLLDHPTIGTIQGIRRIPHVNQFLGVQYATLRDRFSRGELIERYPSRGSPIGLNLNATKHGPIVISLPGAVDSEHMLIQHALPHPEYEMSDTESLRLHIATPSEIQQEGEGLPVVVFFHGGGFFTGSSTWPQYDMAALVELSVRAGTPILALGVNYRLGAPGFLTSSAMRAAGYKPNNGLDDQKLALRWVKRHIKGFGGDPVRVTFLGESAGAVAGCMHLKSEEPLFEQLIAMGGTSLYRPIPQEVAEASFKTTTQRFGIDNLPPEEQVQALLKTPTEELLTKLRGIPIAPIVDGEIIPAVTTYRALLDPESALRLFPGSKWCERVLIGDCQFDANVFMLIGLADRNEALPGILRRCLSARLGPESSSTISELLMAYEVDTSATANTTETIIPVLNFLNDIGFYYPGRIFAQAWSEFNTAFLYHFNSPNPWDGPWKGYATHVLDIVVVLQNYNADLSPGQRACAERFAGDVIQFVNGSSPWRNWERSAPAAMVYYAKEDGERDESALVPNGESKLTERRHVLEMIVGKDRFDELLDVMSMVLAGR